MKICKLKVPVLVEVVKFEQEADFVLDTPVGKYDQNSEELYAVDHSVGVLVPHRKYGLIDGENLLKLSQ